MEHGSTRVPSIAPTADDSDKEKEKGSSDSDRNNNEKGYNEAGLEAPNPGDAEPQEYPKGIKLGFIVIALIMAVFLISLDMVGLFLFGLQSPLDTQQETNVCSPLC